MVGRVKEEVKDIDIVQGPTDRIIYIIFYCASRLKSISKLILNVFSIQEVSIYELRSSPSPCMIIHFRGSGMYTLLYVSLL